MEEFDGVSDEYGPGSFAEDAVTSIMMERRANVETLECTEVPGATDGWFVMDEYATASRSEWSGIKVERAKEGMPCRRVGREGRWA